MEQPAQGSVTTTLVEESNVEGKQEESPSTEAPTLTLRLRPRPTVTWGADVINNEGMGKKSSKREYHGQSLGPNCSYMKNRRDEGF